MKFNHLNVPDHWEHYWTRHPEGYTIMEALINWVSQVDSMVDNVNDWNNRLDEFILQFDADLQGTITNILTEWQESGLLDEIIDEALQTQIDVVEARVEDLSINVKAFGAVGDGVTDDTQAIQDAINFANGGRFVFLPTGTYLISDTLYAVNGKRILLKGEHSRSTWIKATDNFQGYMIKISAGYNLTGIGLTGNGLDGVYGLGDNVGDHGSVSIHDLIITDCEYGIKFDGTAQHPLRSIYEEVLIYNAGTCGIKVASDTQASGQSAFTLDNVVVNNVNMTPVSATAVSVSQGTDTDTIYWANSNAKEFGWTVMRREATSTGINDWEVVGEPSKDTTIITVSKDSGKSYQYEVMRRTVGVNMKWIKALHIGELQSEYVSTGLLIERAYATEIGAFYSEWRSNLDRYNHPIPKGDGIVISLSSSTVIHTAWVENGRYAITIHSSTADVGLVSAGGCFGGVFLNQTSAIYRTKIGKIQGINNKLVFGDGSYRSYEMTDQGNDLENSLEKTISHVFESKYTTRYRGVVQGQFGASVNGGYMNVNSLLVDMKKPVNLKPVLKNNTYKKTLQNGVATQFLKASVAHNKSGSLNFHVLITVTDSYVVIRKTLSNLLTVVISKTPGELTKGTVVSFGEVMQLQAGTLTVAFNTVDSEDDISVTCTATSSFDSPNIAIQLVPISALGDITEMTVL